MSYYNAGMMLILIKISWLGTNLLESNQPDPNFYNIKNVEVRRFHGNECVQRTIELNPNHTGYIHSSDDVLLQWWNDAHFHEDKLAWY